MAAIQEELSLAFDNQAYLSLNLDSGFDSSPSSYENVPVQSSLVNGKKHTLLIIDIPLAWCSMPVMENGTLLFSSCHLGLVISYNDWFFSYHFNK